MGQKANPISLRLNINRDFDSCWYQDSEYANLLTKELRLRKYILSTFALMNIHQGRILFQIFPKKILIHYFFTNSNPSSRQNPHFLQSKTRHFSPRISPEFHLPSLLKKKILLFCMTQSLHLNASLEKQIETKPRLQLFSEIFHGLGISNENLWKFSQSQLIKEKKELKPISRSLSTQSKIASAFIPVKLSSTYQSAHFLAEGVAKSLERNLSFREIFKQIQREIVQNPNVLGFRIQCSGRIGGVEMAKVESRKYGQTSLHTFSGKVDFALAEAYTLYGIVGVKVWVSSNK